MRTDRKENRDVGGSKPGRQHGLYPTGDEAWGYHWLSKGASAD